MVNDAVSYLISDIHRTEYTLGIYFAEGFEQVIVSYKNITVKNWLNSHKNSQTVTVSFKYTFFCLQQLFCFNLFKVHPYFLHPSPLFCTHHPLFHLSYI